MYRSLSGRQASILKFEYRLNGQLWNTDLERISAVILLEEVLIDCADFHLCRG